MYWAEEKQYSVLPKSRHIDGGEFGDCCQVRVAVLSMKDSFFDLVSIHSEFYL